MYVDFLVHEFFRSEKTAQHQVASSKSFEVVVKANRNTSNKKVDLER